VLLDLDHLGPGDGLGHLGEVGVVPAGGMSAGTPWMGLEGKRPTCGSRSGASP
jgi:hypothetical protein